MLKRLMLLPLAVALSSCLSVEVQTNTPVALHFVTATLPSTTPPPASTPTIRLTAATTLAATGPAGCTPRAILLEDVTIPDDTRLAAGQHFTKTWKLQNNGTCPWSDYSLAFVAGDRMSAPESMPVPPVAPGDSVGLSVSMVAPSTDGVYTGYFELRSADGRAVPIGIQSSFWVRILIGNASGTAPAAGTPISPAPLYTPGGPRSCDYFLSTPYHAEVAALINGARRDAGLSALVVNSQLAAAAQTHSIDMACFGLLSHSGSDGSSPSQRVTEAGYVGFLEEIIYASGYPQTAFDWWMNDQVHRDAILNPRARSLGVGYAYVETSLYGGYYTVDFGSQ
jgi:uncharacterized protein YkwD